jgi:hypothetical protein
MLTFTHHVNDALNLHSYSLTGSVVDFDDSIVYVGEHTSRVQSILKSLQYYQDSFQGVTVEYKTVVE